MPRPDADDKWTELLEPDELRFVRRFLLASGSLKEMAQEYGVSYPTIRQRLDGLIEKVRRGSRDRAVSHLRRVVRQMVEAGDIALPEARRILAAGAKDLKDAVEKDENP
ncbi:MAG: DUF2089 family protein [Alphaproteobacteria bacterium]|nr:DUF2089 family protein [Alphaproteobacteria bacterium]